MSFCIGFPSFWDVGYFQCVRHEVSEGSYTVLIRGTLFGAQSLGLWGFGL